MTQRDEAMRAAAETVTIDREPEREEADIATAGADAELARVVAWIKTVRRDEDGDPWDHGWMAALEHVVDGIEARAHWKEGA